MLISTYTNAFLKSKVVSVDIMDWHEWTVVFLWTNCVAQCYLMLLYKLNHIVKHYFIVYNLELYRIQLMRITSCMYIG